MIVSTTPGKVILTGEHAVVYGQPAIVAAVQMRSRVVIGAGMSRNLDLVSKTLDIVCQQTTIKIPHNMKVGVTTTLPIGSGLGSSASLAAGIVGGMSEYLNLGWDKKKINEVTYLVEKISHGNPSGVDNTAVVYGGLLRFERGMNGEKNKLSNLEIRKILHKMWLIDSGKPEETTGEMVQMVKQRYEDNSETDNEFKKIGAISNKLQHDIENDIFTPEWISENERLLESIGVVGEKANSMICEIESIGGFAKVCGAGGVKGGSGVILAYHTDDEKMENWLKQKEYNYFQDHLGGEGWRIE